MTTQTTAFTAAGAGAAFTLQPGQSATYSSSGTFTGYVRFQRSKTQGATWETVQDAAVDTNLAGGTFKNESPSEVRVRFAAFDTDSLTAWTGTCTTVVTDVDDAVRELKDDNGNVYAHVRDSTFELLKSLKYLDFAGNTSPGHVLNFTGMTLAASSNVIRGASVNPTRSSGWTSFSGTVGATPAQVYSDYRELHTSGVAEVLGFGSFPYMDATASCASMFARQDIAFVSAGATVLSAAGAPGVGVFAQWGKVTLDGPITFNAAGVAAAQFLSFQANVTDVSALETSMADWEVASGGIKQMIRFQCSAAKGAQYLINFTDDNGEPVSLTNAGTLNDISATANAGWIRVKVGSSDRYIPLYELKA